MSRSCLFGGVARRPLFNPQGSIDLAERRLIGGDTTNLNDFNNIKYQWVAGWYRQAMNNFWIPEEVNLGQDVKDYPKLSVEERTAYDKTLSFLVFLDSIQTANLPRISDYITANEVNLCLAIQTYQEAVHSQSYSYMLDTICSPDKRDGILYLWRTDSHLLERNTYIGSLYNSFLESPFEDNFMRVLVANYVLEGIYFYSGFMFFYNLARNGKMPGSAQVIRYINRDENTHLWLFREIIRELRIERSHLFTPALEESWREIILQAVRQECSWASYCLGSDIPGLNLDDVFSYIQWLGNERLSQLGLAVVPEWPASEPSGMAWVTSYSNANMIKTDFFEARSTSYAKASALEDDL